MSYLFFAAFIVLFTLKVIGYITVSWWIVTLPLWIGVVLALVLFLGAIIGVIGLAGIGVWLSNKFDK